MLFRSIDEQLVFEQLDNDENAIWSLLLASGYLKVDSCLLYTSKAKQFAWQSHRKEVWKETFYERVVNTYKSGHNLSLIHI